MLDLDAIGRREPASSLSPRRRRRAHPSKRSRAGTARDTYRVLLIEDDPMVADLYASVLRLDGHDVTTAGDGLAGLDALESREFDLVLLDVRMPRMDGLTMLRSLRNDGIAPGVPIAILTNYDDPELREQFSDLGVRDYVVKSRTMPQQVSAKVSEWCS